MSNKKVWIAIVLLLVVASGAGYYFLNGTQVSAQDIAATAPGGATGSLITIQAASSAAGQVSASGNIDLVDERYVALEVSGVVDSIAVRAGDEVAAGDLLLSLDTASLERAARQAELSVSAKRNSLDQLMEEADESDVEAAQAELLEAQENLADVLAGPSASEIAAANSSLSSAWASYNEFLAGPSDDELTQLSAELRRAEIAVTEAQTAYDEIAWRNDAGMTSEAANLQSATVDYESAKASYAESTADADQSDLQSALSSAQNAQSSLDDLLNSPTEAEIAAAEAKVASAEANLDALLSGATDTEIEEVEIGLEQTLIDLEQAYADLEAVNVLATIDGTVLAVNANVGENLSAGAQVILLADAGQLELTVDVAEVDIAQVSVGQPAEIEIDAFPGQTYDGEVSHIEPASDDSSGVVSYPVTVRLTDAELDGVLPGMTAVATVSDTMADVSDGWMVPTSAIQAQGDASVITLVRGESTLPIPVSPGYVQGEWTMVTSSELQPGDQVIGTVTSTVDEEDDQRAPGTGMLMGGGGPPPGGGTGGGQQGGGG